MQTLERPFTDADGARLMSALRFDADNTIADRPMVELLAQIQHMLAGARARAGSGEPHSPRGWGTGALHAHCVLWKCAMQLHFQDTV